MKNRKPYNLLLLLGLSLLISTTLIVIAQELNFINQIELNTTYSENNPILSADGKIIFFNSTKYTYKRNWAKYKELEDRYDYDIYYAIKEGAEWKEPVNLGNLVNTGEDDVIESISPDGRTVYYLSFKKGWGIKGGPFFKAELHGSEWKNVQGLRGGINEFFGTFHGVKYISGASMSPDGKSFYFSTNVRAEYGALDIWVSHIKNGIWKYPENLGPIINAKNASNTSPYIAYDNRTLYFSSNGFGGYGKKEILFSRLRDDGWSLPLNAGNCINTFSSESHISIPASGEIVYFVSSRDGGKGLSDIYTARLSPEVMPSTVILVSGRVLDHSTNNPVEAKIIIDDLLNSSNVYSAWTDSLSGRYQVILQRGGHYSINVESDGYLFSSSNYEIPYDAPYEELKKDHYLQILQDEVNLISEGVFFDTGKATLQEKSKSELDRIVLILVNNKDLTLEISGHTDNIGSEKNNQELSEQRANTVMEYMIEIGKIEQSRIKAKGFGEQYPRVSNDTDEGRQKNRRTEFKFYEK
ncbi:OmpA family protein [Bacteroidota bacterium]